MRSSVVLSLALFGALSAAFAQTMPARPIDGRSAAQLRGGDGACTDVGTSQFCAVCLENETGSYKCTSAKIGNDPCEPTTACACCYTQEAVTCGTSYVIYLSTNCTGNGAVVQIDCPNEYNPSELIEGQGVCPNCTCPD
jgi:hypothetical protein